MMIDILLYLLIGTYTSNQSEGFYMYNFNTEDAKVQYISETKVENPSFLTVSTSGDFIYSVSENSDESSAVHAYSFDKEKNEIHLINKQNTNGVAPCYITIDKNRTHAITANYGSGNISVFAITEDGGLSPESQTIQFEGSSINKERQNEPHLHCVQFSPDGRFLFANDLGTDRIYKFKVNPNNSKNYLQQKKKETIDLKPGSGPRHLTFHPNGKLAYLINELSGTIECFHYDTKKGKLDAFQTVLADEYQAEGSGDIHISPNGDFLYASLRIKNDGIAIYSIDEVTGELQRVGYQNTGAHPRNFTISPSGDHLLVACRDTNKVEIYEVDKETGLLTPTNKAIELSNPVFVTFFK